MSATAGKRPKSQLATNKPALTSPSAQAAEKTIKPPNRFKKLALWLLVLPGIPFLLLSLGIFLYAFWPISLSQFQAPTLSSDSQYLFLAVHGVKDRAGGWAGELANFLANRERTENPSEQYIALDWNPYAQNTFRCAVDGQRIGEHYAAYLATKKQLRDLHLVAHSCGSFVIYGLCKQLKNLRPDINIQTIYLAPTTVYGGLFWHYGSSRFGSCADFSELFFDADDKVPGASHPLINAYNTELFTTSNSKKRSPHLRPIDYYRNKAQSGDARQLRDDAQLAIDYPPGHLVKVNYPEKTPEPFQ